MAGEVGGVGLALVFSLQKKLSSDDSEECQQQWPQQQDASRVDEHVSTT